MIKNLLLVAAQVITLFLMMGVGFFLSRKSKLTQEGVTQMTYLLLYVVSPCIIIRSMQVVLTPGLLLDLGICVLAAVLFYVITALGASRLFGRRPDKTRVCLQYGMVYGNIGFMGLPLIQAVLGQEAILFVVFFLVVFTISYWTHGVALMGGRSTVSPKTALLNPGVLGVAVGLPLLLLQVHVPGTLFQAISFLADLNTPLAMVVIGAQMSATNLRATFQKQDLYLASFFRLLLTPLITALVLLPFRLNPLLYSVIVILAGTPVAGVTAMFAQRYDRDVATAAQLVTLSTLLSVITLPIVAAVGVALTV